MNSSDISASLEARREVQAATGTRARSRETATSSGGQNREEQSLSYDLAMSALGHSLPIQFAPEFSNVRYASDSDRQSSRHKLTLCANTGHRDKLFGRA